MKFLAILSAIIGATLAHPTVGYGSYQQPAYAVVQAPAPTISVAPISSYGQAPSVPVVTGTLHLTQDTYGQYKYGYAISDGQQKEENKAAEDGTSGHFSYTSPEGQQIKLAYTAGKDGFIASGDHLPKQVELPEELAAAYREANARLQEAHEQARLRGDTEEQQQGGGHASYEKGNVPVRAPVAVPYVPVAVPAAPKPQVHYSAVIPSLQYAPVAPSAPKVEEPASYSSSSYQSEIGAPVAVPEAPSAQYAPVPAIPAIQYVPAAPAVPSIKYPAAPSVQYPSLPAAPSVQYSSAPASSSGGYASAPASSSGGYAPASSGYASAPAEPEVKEPVPYSVSSYQAEIGGPVAIAAPSAAPSIDYGVPSAPAVQYGAPAAVPAVAIPVKSSSNGGGYSSNGY